MMNWIEAVSELSRQDRGFVIVTILSVQGSAPRQAGTKMVVDDTTCHDSIGGGNLEHQAIARSRQLLDQGRKTAIRQEFVLGNDLSQCCGGKVELLFECLPARYFNVVLFGAGHVGKQLAIILGELPCRLRWIDSRPEFVDTVYESVDASNTTIELMSNPYEAVEQCPADSYYLVITHSHEMDMELVEAILSRNDARFCGLIGSKSKAAKFRSRLGRKGFSDAEVSLLTCPIGLDQVQGKRPMEVAVSIAGQLIQIHGDASACASRITRDDTGMYDNVVKIGEPL
jgi:xanthine dehydrogenase accessory factor